MTIVVGYLPRPGWPGVARSGCAAGPVGPQGTDRGRDGGARSTGRHRRMAKVDGEFAPGPSSRPRAALATARELPGRECAATSRRPSIRSPAARSRRPLMQAVRGSRRRPVGSRVLAATAGSARSSSGRPPSRCCTRRRSRSRSPRAATGRRRQADQPGDVLVLRHPGVASCCPHVGGDLAGRVGAALRIATFGVRGPHHVPTGGRLHAEDLVLSDGSHRRRRLSRRPSTNCWRTACCRTTP